MTLATTIDSFENEREYILSLSIKKGTNISLGTEKVVIFKHVNRVDAPNSVSYLTGELNFESWYSLGIENFLQNTNQIE